MKLKGLVGNGDKIGIFTAPFLLVGLILNFWQPQWFAVGGPASGLKTFSLIILFIGVVIWFWSVILILTKVPKNELITTGPFVLVKHPLYTSVALLVLPALGFLLNSWLGAAIGFIMYLASRKFAPLEEQLLAQTFGPAWEEYCKAVKLPWL